MKFLHIFINVLTVINYSFFLLKGEKNGKQKDFLKFCTSGLNIF